MPTDGSTIQCYTKPLWRSDLNSSSVSVNVQQLIHANFTKNNPLACCSAISRRNSVTTVADRTNQKCAQLQHNICVAWIHTCKKKAYLHIQKAEPVFCNLKQVTYTCRYISGVLANPSLGNLVLPATAAQGKPKSPVLQLQTHTGLAPAVSTAPLTCHSIAI